MPFYRDRVYPHLVSMLGDPKPIREVRQRIVPLAQGKVLEIGVGPGVNFMHYDPEKVSKLYALEPNPGMLRLAEQHRRRTMLDVEFLDLPGERIPLENQMVESGLISSFIPTEVGYIAELQLSRGFRAGMRYRARIIGS